MRTASAILSLAILLGSGWAWATYRNFTADITRVNAIPASKAGIDGTDQNILIVGSDDRESATDKELADLGTTRDNGSLNTDTMMLLHVPANGAKATMISFPRDSWVDIPGHGQDKLNSAYHYGLNASNGDKNAGARLLVKTIENITGLTIDHYVQVDLISFYRISNAIGGVDICLNNAMGPNQDSDENGRGYSGIDLPKGHSIIKGKQALAFVRQRHGLPQGDLDRIIRQQYFLSAVFRKMTSAGVLLNPLKLQDLMKAVSSSLVMDKNMDPLKLAQQMQNLQAGNLTFSTIPNNGSVWIGDVSAVQLNTAAIPDFIAGIVGADAATEVKKATAAAKGSFTVSVLNGSGENLLATKNSQALNNAGFKAVVDEGDPGTYSATTIKYAKGHEGEAKALLSEVPRAKVVRDNAVTHTTLIIGANKVQAKALMPTKPTTSSPNPPTSSSGGTRTAADAGCIN